MSISSIAQTRTVVNARRGWNLQLLPGVVITCLGHLLQHHGVTPWLTQ